MVHGKPDWLKEGKVPNQFWHLLNLNLEDSVIFLQIKSSTQGLFNIFDNPDINILKLFTLSDSQLVVIFKTDFRHFVLIHVSGNNFYLDTTSLSVLN